MPFTVTSTFTGAGTGTWTYVDDVGAQVALLTAQVTALNALITANLTPAGIATPGTPVAIMSATAVNVGGIWESLEDANKRMQELSTAIVNVEARLATLTTGVAVATHHMAASVTTQQMAYIDQAKNNEFQQKTTNQALADVGKPPTIVTPQNILDKVKANIQDVSVVKAEQSATNMVTSYISETLVTAYETSTTWFLNTALGKFLVETWTKIKAGTKSFFSFEWAKAEINSAKRAANNVKAGSPDTLG